MNAKKILIGVAILVVLGGIVFANLYFKRETGVEVQVEKIEKRDLEAIVSASGKIQPKRSVNISADTIGRVTRLAVEEGEKVEAGQIPEHNFTLKAEYCHPRGYPAPWVSQEEIDAYEQTLLEDAAGDAVLLGPAREGDRDRWLIQGPDLGRVRIRLRGAVRQLRDGGSRVRVDADPVDL